MEKRARSHAQHVEITAKRERERIKNKFEKEALCQRRLYQAKLTKERDGAVKEALIEKFEEDENHLSKLKAEKEKELMILKEERAIHM